MNKPKMVCELCNVYPAIGFLVDTTIDFNIGHLVCVICSEHPRSTQVVSYQGAR